MSGKKVTKQEWSFPVSKTTLSSGYMTITDFSVVWTKDGIFRIEGHPNRSWEYFKVRANG